MRRSRWLAPVVLVLLAAPPALAGGYEKKCTASTQECLDVMAAKMKNSGWVGVELEQDEVTGTLTVKRVIPGSPAEAAGIQEGDVLHALNGVRIAKDNEDALKKARKEWKPGQSVVYTVKRDGLDRQVTITLAPMPADVMAKWIGEHMLQHASAEVSEKKN